MTLVQPEATAPKKTDPNALMALSLAAIATRHEELRERDRQDDERAVHHAQAVVREQFGDAALAALGEWLPSPDMPEGTYQAFVELLPLTSLICTIPRDLSLPTFEILAYCGTCSQHSTTVISSLAELAGALRKAGVR
ncbi:hypothetical protein JHN55_31650 [Streptomyces sp. MBT56]|uniref:hypothetical protein n=1 Tax=unclassified Streptomyces TaxID=2593676 RepID=UPI00190938DD|nr:MULTISPECIES: hypothetical protein [unclassified Streptomyces]MBK3561008.1 hypothetical protein [Streptomyces sp. MBT56]MBK3605618.1 hypothetical protein [Streptomyces sp. MBT54]MBK3619919.1 hypothetical protein [Streptomyces sp. MBT98]MBK6045733.1 hypothetical protein [Streptomyces sp. MBT55]